MKFLLNQLSKEQLIDLIEKQEARHERAMSNFEHYFKSMWRNQYQEGYTALFRNKYYKQLNHAMECIREIANELNRENDDTAKQIQYILEEHMIFVQKRGKFQEEYLGAFTDIGEKGFREWEANREKREAWPVELKQKLINEINNTNE